MPRTKQVFTNSQLAHVWAQQIQSTGRNSSGAMYFNDSIIWSYGSHYCLARIYTKGAKRIALVNEYGYSMSTGMHRNCVSRALSGLMDEIRVSTPNDLKQSLADKAKAIPEFIASELRVVKVTSEDAYTWPIERIQDLYDDLNKLRWLSGKGPIKAKAKAKDLAAIRVHYAKRYKRYLELNTPEMRAKRAKESEHRAELKAAKERAALQDAVGQWRAGNSYANVRGVYPHILRIKGDTVQTSGGAEVPLDHALRAYRMLTKGELKAGERIGHFTVEDTYLDQHGHTISIGCHHILKSEADAVLGPLVQS